MDISVVINNEFSKSIIYKTGDHPWQWLNQDIVNESDGLPELRSRQISLRQILRSEINKTHETLSHREVHDLYEDQRKLISLNY